MSILDCLISNVTMAAAMAVVAVLIGKLTRSPQIRHALWLLVLAKLVTPPIVELPIASSASEWF
jgi:bla regulator protein blaR1